MTNVPCSAAGSPLLPSPLLPNPQPPIPNPYSRRGVLLLVVLSLLVLFVLIGVTFVLVASQYRRSSRAAGRAELVGDDPGRQLDEVFSQIVRDTTNPNSVLQGHSLLNDLYGNDGFRVTTTSVPTAININKASGSIISQQIAEIVIAAPAGATYSLPVYSGYLNGRVMTVINPQKGPPFSMRIVGYSYNSASSTYTVRVLVPEGVALVDFFATVANVVLPSGSLCVINGRPFNGTGFGFDTTNTNTSRATLIDAIDANGNLIALVPNGKYFPGAYSAIAGVGGADEDYDAPDPQNMALAYMPINPTASNEILPSFHRPDLITYSGGGGMPIGKLRQTSLRPIGREYTSSPPDHPNFTGSNSSFDPVNGPWDVDNDGDGIADSIWVDVGFPVQTAPDGRRFKPLAAILCIDLDGRLNVNAHGSIAHVDGSATMTSVPATTAAAAITIPNNLFVGGALPTNLARGQGYGPAEINLLNGLFGGSMANYQALLASRYDEPNSNLSTTGPAYAYTAPDYSNNAAVYPVGPYPGITHFNDYMRAINQTAFQPLPPYSAVPTPFPLNAYGSPPDTWGRGFVAVDARGTPWTPMMGDLNDRRDDPYEINLNRHVRASTSPVATRSAYTTSSEYTTPSPHDNPFTAAELERVLRLYDIDAPSLPDRLRQLLSTATNPRNAVTTESVDLPSPSILPTREIVKLAGNPAKAVGQHIVDLLRLKLRAPANASTASVNAEIQKMLPPEVVAGLRLDLNRPFGNGRDDNGNGIVDEPGEPETSIWQWNPTMHPNTPASFANASPVPTDLTNGADMNGSGKVDATDGLHARHLQARYLYVLMRLLLDNSTRIDFDANPDNQTGFSLDRETPFGIAQWAINVVDFRDRDSIMTPFEFDLDPFNGWNVDGILGSGDDTGPDRGVVWGCERPELLITETLAFHDRRTEDLPNDDHSGPNTLPEDMQAGTTTDMSPKKDTDFDQRLLPRGSLFIELYNPWNTQTTTLPPVASAPQGSPTPSEVPGEFYSAAAGKGLGIKLDQTTPGGFPVWRMILVNPDALNQDQEGNPLDPDPNNPNLTIDRSIYFVQPPAPIPNSGQAYFSSIPSAVLLPGRYAVVGSRGVYDQANNTYTTTIGREKNTTTAPDIAHDGINGLSSMRSIVLQPNLDPNSPTQQVRFNNPGLIPAEPAATAPNQDIQYPIAVVVDKALDGAAVADRSVSISEPPSGYGVPFVRTPVGMPGEDELILSSVLDAPLDNNNVVLNQPTSHANFRWVYLQRLANPTADWNAGTNPYLSIDRMPIPLTVFSGVASQAAGGGEILFNNPSGIASLQRGENVLGQPPLPLWRAPFAPTQVATSPPGPGSPAQNFDFVLKHSFGYLNDPYTLKLGRYVGVGSSTPGTQAPTYSFAGSPLPPSGTSLLAMPWLTWNNRPFVAPAELLLVPKSRSSRLLLDFNVPTVALTPVPATALGSSVVVSGRTHLLDFFRITQLPGSLSANFYRLLEYVRVPSPFVGTETELNPQTFNSFGGSASYNADVNESSFMSAFHPPFNKVSNYREPGRVNINTIPSDTAAGASSLVWTAILNGTSKPTWPTVLLSRQGTAGGAGGVFGNPFRSPAGAAFMLPPGSTSTRERDVTFFRLDTGNSWLFDYTSSVNSLGSPDDATSNPYFRFQTLQRLSNLLTTRSNVYAVWITVGYFEATPAPPAPTQVDYSIYPDGYQLGQELGSDSGEIKRHRAFYIFDRSLPVGFEPGKDHNIDKGVLVKRFVE